MPSFLQKVAIKMAKTDEEKVKLIKATNDIEFVKRVIEGKEVSHLNKDAVIELVQEFNLVEDVLTGKLRIGSIAFLGMFEKTELLQSCPEVAEKVLLGEINIGEIDSVEKIDIAKTSEILSRRVLLKEIDIGELTVWDKVRLASATEDLARDALQGRLGIDEFDLTEQVGLAKQYTSIARDVLQGKIEIKGLTRSGKLDLLYKKPDLIREVLIGNIEIDGITSDEKIWLIVGESEILEQIICGEIKVQGLNSKNAIGLVKPGSSVALKLVRGELENVALDVDQYIYFYGNKDSIREEKDEYLKKLRSVLSSEIPSTEIKGDNINDLISAAKVLGADRVYSLLKYYNSPEDRISFSKVLKEPEAFKKFAEFAKSIFVGQASESMDDKRLIDIYTQKNELILDCMNGGLTEQELRLFTSVLKSGDMSKSISSRNDLQEWPKVREEKISQMINEEFEAVYSLLTGLDYGDYISNMRQYLSKELFENVLENFNEDQNKPFQKMEALCRLIEIIEKFPIEKRQEVLHKINLDLSNEFTEQGSVIAQMRDAFEDVEVQVKRLYGHELSQTLANEKLPEPADKKAQGVKVIKLEGQEFKLLIHMEDKQWGKRDESEVRRTHICTSLISDEHMARYTTTGFCFGFKNLEPNAMVMESSINLGSNSMINYNSLEVDALSYSFGTVEEILEESKGKAHNEIVLWREYMGEDGKMKKIKPDFLVAFSKIDRETLKEAKRLGLPIVLIDEEKYKKKIEDKKQEESEIPEGHEGKTVKSKDIYKETIGKVADIVPALKQERCIQEIVAEMQKGREDKDRAEITCDR